MKHIQGSKFSGYVQITVTGENPERFLQHCANNGIMFWDISKPEENLCIGKILLQDIKALKRLRAGTGYKVKFRKRYGLPFILQHILNRKPLLFGLILSILLLFVISNMIWKVEVTGVPDELETKIRSSLESYGVQPGAFKMMIGSPNQIQQQLINDLPELLWIGVDLKGTTYYLEGVEKIVVKDEAEKSPRHLVANKSAVIKSMYVKKGQPLVRENDLVEKGEILVSGAIEKLDTNQTDEEEHEEYEWVAAEGKVMAVTWYEVDVTVPLKIQSEKLTGNVKQSYQIQIGNLNLPIWPWHSNGFSDEIHETDIKQPQILGWSFPVKLIKERQLEKTVENVQITAEEAVKRAMEQAEKKLKLELGKDARILSEKVLHETKERGKVKLSLYITVEENIAIEQPINQGD